MSFKTDLLSRLKAARYSSASDASSKKASIKWLFILLLGLLLIGVAAVYSFYRFSYWVSIEDRVAATEVTAAHYDEEAIREILEKFDEKDLARKELLGGVSLDSIQVDTGEVATTTLEIREEE